MWTALISGFITSLGLILAIGAQNAFVLRQGLRREHVLMVVATCAISDALLISLGVGGFAAVLPSARSCYGRALRFLLSMGLCVSGRPFAGVKR